MVILETNLMKRLFFLHIHKTAGTAVSRAIESSLPANSICPVNFEYEFFDKERVGSADCGTDNWHTRVSEYKFFRGHFGLEVRNSYFPDAMMLTFLREPVDRLVSAYLFWLKQAFNDRIPEAKQHLVALKLRDMDFEEFVFSDDPDIVNATHNVQARLLAGAHFGRTAERRTQVFGPNTGKSQILEEAMNFVTSTNNLVGLSSQVEVMLEQVAKYLDLTIPRAEQLRKASQQDKAGLNLTSRSLNRAREITRLDRELFDFVLSRRV